MSFSFLFPGQGSQYNGMFQDHFEEFPEFSEVLGQGEEFYKENLKEIIFNNNSFRVHLLQGTTGSGKTIVYFNAIKKIIENQKQCLILLPEIGLTGEFEKKFKNFFGFEAAIWHSKITPKRKKIIWSGLASGDIKVVIGARSALFLPFIKLGLIVVDEEHDQSFKQQEGFRYDAKFLASTLAPNNAKIIYSSATPSLSLIKKSDSKEIGFFHLDKRFGNFKKPNINIHSINKQKLDRKSTRLNSSHVRTSRMPSSA
mgnify:CR=1 FL=1